MESPLFLEGAAVLVTLFVEIPWISVIEEDCVVDASDDVPEVEDVLDVEEVAEAVELVTLVGPVVYAVLVASDVPQQSVIFISQHHSVESAVPQYGLTRALPLPSCTTSGLIHQSINTPEL